MQKPRWSSLILITALVLTFLGAGAAAAPQPGQKPQNEQAEKKEPAPDSTIYRVSYKVNELENGKTINSRSYTLMAQVDKRATLRTGSRIPVAFQSKLDYQRVGMAFSCTLRQREENLIVHSDFNMDSVANKEGASYPTTSPPIMRPPVMRQFSLSDDTVATLGKPAFVGSIDDVASNHRYVIEVTVTKAE